VDGSRDYLEKRGGHNLDVSSVLVNVLPDSFSRVHIVTVAKGHLFHDLNQGLN
jgi:hypothetical protein